MRGGADVCTTAMPYAAPGDRAPPIRSRRSCSMFDIYRAGVSAEPGKRPVDDLGSVRLKRRRIVAG